MPEFVVFLEKRINVLVVATSEEEAATLALRSAEAGQPETAHTVVIHDAGWHDGTIIPVSQYGSSIAPITIRARGAARYQGDLERKES